MQIYYLLRPVDPETRTRPVLLPTLDVAMDCLRMTAGDREPITLSRSTLGQSVFMLDTGEVFTVDAIRFRDVAEAL